jgi:hypothetical protein
LLEILNEGLPAEDRPQHGGDHVIHHLAREFGYMAVKRTGGGDPGPGAGEDAMSAMAGAMRTLAKFFMLLADTMIETSNGSGLSSARTHTLSNEGYEAQTMLQTLLNVITKVGDLH